MIIALDIETKRPISDTDGATPDNFLIGAIVDEYEEHLGYFYTPEDMWNYIISLGKKLNRYGKRLYVYSANHRFDWYIYAPRDDPNIIGLSDSTFLFKYKEDELTHLGRTSRPKFYGGKERRDYIIFLDLFSIYNASIRSDKTAGLARVGELIGYPKRETPACLLDTSIKKDMSVIKPYLDDDCYIVIKALHAIKELLKAENISVKVLYSINGISINRVIQLLKRQSNNGLLVEDGYKVGFPSPQYPSHHAQGTRLHSQFCRGGFNHTFATGTYESTWKLDLNGFWQHCLATMDCPDLATEHLISDPLSFLSYDEIFSKIGYADVILESPALSVPFIAVREGDSNTYPQHTCLIKGQYCLNELAYAVSIGYKIVHMNFCVLFEKLTHNPFTQIVLDTYALRKQSQTPLHNWFYKQMGNSFVGKFAQATLNKETISFHARDVEKYTAEGYTVIRGLGTYYIAEKVTGYNAKAYYAPIIYAYVTATSRIRLHKELSKLPASTLLYSDVDSIITTADIETIQAALDIGPNLGQWKIENIDTLPAKSTIYKNKFYEFGTIRHASGVSLKELSASAEMTSLTRRRMITQQMAKEDWEIGLFKTEQITLQESEKIRRKVYIDTFAVLTAKDREILSGYITDEFTPQ